MAPNPAGAYGSTGAAATAYTAIAVLDRLQPVSDTAAVQAFVICGP
jgi:hypothetical protein